MSPKIYASPFPPVSVVNRSVVTHVLFSPQEEDPGFVGRFPGSSPAFIDAVSGTTLTRDHFRELVLSFAHGLRHHPKVATNRGDTVLIFSHNSLAWPVVLYGAIAAGLRCTLANSGYTSPELAFQYVDSSAKFIITSQEAVPLVREMFASLNMPPSESDSKIIVLSECLHWAGGPSGPRGWGTLLTMEELLVTGTLPTEEKFDGDEAHETVYLCYSSGTTGKPKGVETTHQNITTVLDAVFNSFDRLEPGVDCILAFLPFFHMYGAVKLLLYPLYIGVPIVIMKRFDPAQFCKNVERYKVTFTFVAPPVLVVLARHPAVDMHDMTTLRILFAGAAPLGASLVEQLRTRFISISDKHKKLSILQGYGLTETSPTTHMLSSQDGERKMGSIGPLLASLEARIVDDDEGEVDAKEGEAGELWIRGYTIMKGYLNNPSATKASITEDGWFKTGDIVIRDTEGYYYIVDRKKELIKYKGFQVAPAELESVLLTHPDITDAAVIGIDSVEEPGTELPRAYVVPVNPENVKTADAQQKFSEEIKSWIQQKVSRHKYLRGGVIIIDAIPKSAAGKILRKTLRAQAREETVTVAKL